MKRNLWKVVLWALVAVLESSFQTLSAEENKGKGWSIFTLPEILNFDNGNIFLNEEGFSYSIHTLNRIGDQWLATIFNIDNLKYLNYCPKGHMTSEGCHLCHTPGCYYYVRPCQMCDEI